ncbi:hypothetical protein LSH36_1451g00000, partial [Paralvinella palmiformis]
RAHVEDIGSLKTRCCQQGETCEYNDHGTPDLSHGRFIVGINDSTLMKMLINGAPKYLRISLETVTKSERMAPDVEERVTFTNTHNIGLKRIKQCNKTCVPGVLNLITIIVMSNNVTHVIILIIPFLNGVNELSLYQSLTEVANINL